VVRRALFEEEIEALDANMSDSRGRVCNDEAMTERSDFDALIEEGGAEPTDGWDFSWFEGRATEGRPSWRYLEGLTRRINGADAVLDVQTGGGERFAQALRQSEALPAFLAATESWPPNVVVARQTLAPLGVSVVDVVESDPFPFGDNAFDLVCSRHPTMNHWSEIYRVMGSGGLFYSQQIGAGTNSELTDFIMGPQLMSDDQRMDVTVDRARTAGLDVIDAREESLPVVFFDVGAVVYFLRKVPWTVPDFSVDKYWDRLVRLHRRIERDGEFTSHSKRFLIEARKPTN